MDLQIIKTDNKFISFCFFYFIFFQNEAHLRLDGLDLSLNDLEEISLYNDRIEISGKNKFNHHIYFKNAPEPPSTLQAILDNLSTLMTEAATLYPQYSNHNITLNIQ